MVILRLLMVVATLLAAWSPASAGAEPVTTASFTKIANSGHELPPGAPLGEDSEDWACLQDTQTGLVWEVKTADGGLRDHHWTYTPFDGNAATNGGYPGYKDKSSGNCLREDMEELSCNTQAYIRAVRKSRLCGFDDWRLPGISELVAVATETAAAAPAATTRLLPNTLPGWYWTGIESIGVTRFSRVILLPPGGQPTFYDGSYLVIAVRGGTTASVDSDR